MTTVVCPPSTLAPLISRSTHASAANYILLSLGRPLQVEESPLHHPQTPQLCIPFAQFILEQLLKPASSFSCSCRFLLSIELVLLFPSVLLLFKLADKVQLAFTSQLYFLLRMSLPILMYTKVVGLLTPFLVQIHGVLWTDIFLSNLGCEADLRPTGHLPVAQCLL